MNFPKICWMVSGFVLSSFVGLGISGSPCKSGSVAGIYAGYTCELTESGVGSIPANATALRMVTKDTRRAMGNVTLPHLPNLKILEYDVTNGLDVSQGPFVQLSYLEDLQLFHRSSGADDFRFVLEAGIFEGLSRLRRLILSDLGLQVLPIRVLDGLDNLRILELNKNGLSDLPAGTFTACCQELSVLTLSRNRISDLGLVSWHGLSRLRTLDLSGNRLTALNERDFVGLQNLASVDLANNEVERIADQTLRRLSKLESLHLSRNRFRFSTDEDDYSTSDTSSPKNHLQGQGRCRGPFCGLSSLLTLEISDNNITGLPTQAFGDLVSLTKLDLSGNHIDDLRYEHFGSKVLQSLEELDVRGNHITTLSRSFQRAFRRLAVVDVSSNPWRCDCDIHWLTEWLRDTTDTDSGTIEVKNLQGTWCATPVLDELLTEAYVNRSGECSDSSFDEEEDTPETESITDVLTTADNLEHLANGKGISPGETTESWSTESRDDENTKETGNSLPGPENIRLPGDGDTTSDTNDDHISTGHLTSGLAPTSHNDAESSEVIAVLTSTPHQTTLHSVTEDIRTLDDLLVTEIASLEQMKTCDVFLSTVTENMKTLDSLLRKTTANIDTLNNLLLTTIDSMERNADTRDRTTKSPVADEHRRNSMSVRHLPNIALQLSMLLTVSGLVQIVWM